VRVRCDGHGFLLHDSLPEHRAAHRRLRLLTPAVLAAMAACSSPPEIDPLVIEGPARAVLSAEPAQAASEQAPPMTIRAHAADSSAGGTAGAARDTPARAVHFRVNEIQREPTPPMFRMGLVAMVPEPSPPLHPGTHTATPKTSTVQHRHEESEDFDFGI
jgi:hypothetical protein